MLSVLDLAVYIQNDYHGKTGKQISNIKLQKSLYFLFAMWGGFIQKARENEDNVEDNLSTKYDSELFSDRIEAWTYGPVVPIVYHNIDSYRKTHPKFDIDDEFLKSFVDSVLKDIYAVSDFKLVDISHEDSSWRNNYCYNDERHDKEMPHEMIISEYANK